MNKNTKNAKTTNTKNESSDIDIIKIPDSDALKPFSKHLKLPKTHAQAGKGFELKYAISMHCKHAPKCYYSKCGRSIYMQCLLRDECARHMLNYINFNHAVTGIPVSLTRNTYDKYTDKQVEAHEYIMKLLEDSKFGVLMLSGQPGCGKTHTAAAIVRDLILTNPHGGPQQARWVDASSMHSFAHDIFDSTKAQRLASMDADGTTAEEVRLIKSVYRLQWTSIDNYKEASLLVFDGFDDISMTQTTIELLMEIMLARVMNNKPIIITTNSNMKTFIDCIQRGSKGDLNSQALVDRLVAYSKTIEFKGASLRFTHQQEPPKRKGLSRILKSMKTAKPTEPQDCVNLCG